LVCSFPNQQDGAWVLQIDWNNIIPSGGEASPTSYKVTLGLPKPVTNTASCVSTTSTPPPTCTTTFNIPTGYTTGQNYTVTVTANGGPNPSATQSNSITVKPGTGTVLDNWGYEKPALLWETQNNVKKNPAGKVASDTIWTLTVDWNNIQPPAGEPYPPSFKVELVNSSNTAVSPTVNATCTQTAATCTHTFTVTNIKPGTYTVRVTANGAPGPSTPATLQVVPNITSAPTNSQYAAPAIISVAKTAAITSGQWGVVVKWHPVTTITSLNTNILPNEEPNTYTVTFTEYQNVVDKSNTIILKSANVSNSSCNGTGSSNVCNTTLTTTTPYAAVNSYAVSVVANATSFASQSAPAAMKLQSGGTAAACTSDSNCPSGETCTNGVCQVSSTTNSQFATPKIVGQTNTGAGNPLGGKWTLQVDFDPSKSDTTLAKSYTVLLYDGNGNEIQPTHTNSLCSTGVCSDTYTVSYGPCVTVFGKPIGINCLASTYKVKVAANAEGTIKASAFSPLYSITPNSSAPPPQPKTFAYPAPAGFQIKAPASMYNKIVGTQWNLTVQWNPVKPPTGAPTISFYSVTLAGLRTNPNSACSTAVCTSYFTVPAPANKNTKYNVTVKANVPQGDTAQVSSIQVTP
jgi:hypothetical protein